MCIFCKIVTGDLPARKVYEDEMVLGFEDLNPAAPIHYLFIPKKHVADAIEAAAHPGLMDAVFGGIRSLVLERGLKEDGIRLVTNVGEGAGQSVFHFHVHVLGGRDLHWPPG